MSVWTLPGEVIHRQLDHEFITLGQCLGLSYGLGISHPDREWGEKMVEEGTSALKAQADRGRGMFGARRERAARELGKTRRRGLPRGQGSSTA